MPPAGQVNVVLNVNQANYSKAMDEAAKKLDVFAGKSKTAGHATVTSMQAASASIRLLDNPLTMNVRALERFATQSKLVGQIFQAAFPVVGAIAAISVISKLGTEVADFIKKVNEMPKAIEKGFNSLHLASASAADSLRLTNDELSNSIAKLQGKPQNNLAIVLDEARIKADELAKSLEADADKVKALLGQNKLSGWSMLMGKAGTANVSSSVNSFNDDITSIGGKRAEATRSGNTVLADQLTKQLTEKQNAALAWAKSKLFLIDNPQYAVEGDGIMGGDNSANRNILKGFTSTINDSRSLQSEKDRNSALVPEQKAAQVAHEAALKAAAARKAAAAELTKALEENAAYGKLWQNFENGMAKILAEDTLDKFKTNGLSSADSKSLGEAGAASRARITAMSESIKLNKQNSDAIAEASLQMAVATGQISRMDAARVQATIHQKQYADGLQLLKDQAKDIAIDPQYNNREEARQAAQLDNRSRQSAWMVSGGIQTAQDNQNINPASSSGLVGAKNALDEFTNSSRDAARQIGEFANSTITGFNDVLVQIMSTRSTGMQNRMALGNYGAGLFRNVAGMGLQKAEGSVLGALGFGSKPDGSQAKPLYVRIADGVGGAASSAGGFLSGLFGGSKGPGKSGLSSALGIVGAAGGVSPIASVLTDMIPFLASGGPINGPAIVGEQGPELFVPNSNGSIIPNSRLSSGNGGTNTTHVTVDARGAHDPAQTEAAVNRGIAAAAPHIVAASMNAMNSSKARKPMSSH